MHKKYFEESTFYFSLSQSIDWNAIFDSANISYYNFSNGFKRLAKTGPGGHNEGVYLSGSLAEKPSFSVKILHNPIHAGLCTGVAFDSSRFTQHLASFGWCIDTHMGGLYAQGYFSQRGNILENQKVTVSVDFSSKSIRYEVDSQSAGPPWAFNLTDAEMHQLRGIVHIHFPGDSVEIVD